MRRPRWTALLGLLFLAVALALGSCDDDLPGFQPDADCIGPTGGTITETDSSSALFGVSLEVRPGAWQECWTVYLGYKSTFSTPDFPEGLEGYEGMLTGALDLSISRQVSPEQSIDPPDLLPMELSFPVGDLTVEPGEMLTAFRWDEGAGLYRLELPDDASDERITIHTSQHRPLWTWGKVHLGEVDFDTYLEPVMVEHHGTGTWVEIQATLDSLRQADVEQQAALTCSAVKVLRSSMVAARESAAADVRATQNAFAGRCGDCDATTTAFYVELKEYVRLEAGQILSDLILGSSRNPLVRIYGLFLSAYIEYSIRELDCDFECFADSIPPSFYGQLAIFFAAEATVELIDWAIATGIVECPS